MTSSWLFVCAGSIRGKGVGHRDEDECGPRPGLVLLSGLPVNGAATQVMPKYTQTPHSFYHFSFEYTQIIEENLILGFGGLQHQAHVAPCTAF